MLSGVPATYIVHVLGSRINCLKWVTTVKGDHYYFQNSTFLASQYRVNRNYKILLRTRKIKYGFYFTYTNIINYLILVHFVFLNLATKAHKM